MRVVAGVGGVGHHHQNNHLTVYGILGNKWENKKNNHHRHHHEEEAEANGVGGR